MELVLYPSPILAESAAPIHEIDGGTRLLAEQMLDLMENERGIGLAAPQVGSLSRLFVCRLPRESRRWAFANPEIVGCSRRTVRFEESCLSVPGVYAHVRRPAWVRIRALDLEGRRVEMKAGGLLARVIQHEVDHLDGVMFLDHLKDRRRDRALEHYIGCRSA